MKALTLVICLLGVSGNASAGCNSYESCQKSVAMKNCDYAYEGWCEYQPSGYEQFKAICYKLDEISKKLDKRVLTTPDGDIVIDDGKDDGVEVIKKPHRSSDQVG